MEADAGLKRFLRVPALYDVFQDIIGGNALRQWFIQTHVRARPGDKIVDIGCGPGQILPWLPPVEYVGLDINADYVSSAQRKYGSKATFVLGDTRSLWGDLRFRHADIVIGLGILHHLNDDEALRCIRFAHQALKPGGRFVCLEACWTPKQSFLSKYVMRRDRGQYIRTERGYHELLQTEFRWPQAWVQRKPMRVPYVTIVLECEK